LTERVCCRVRHAGQVGSASKAPLRCETSGHAEPAAGSPAAVSSTVPASRRGLVRPRTRAPTPLVTDAELVCLAVAQVLLRFNGEHHWLRDAPARVGHLFAGLLAHLPAGRFSADDAWPTCAAPAWR
jgi:hypothetical protein